MFVFGFQEVDMSAEGLLYRTTAAKEEAWSAGIFEALGNAADEYVKVHSPFNS